MSDKAEKTISVLVERVVKHPKYKKIIKKHKKYAVHDANNKYKVGDRVSIIESRPISKNKHWTVLDISEAEA